MKIALCFWGLTRSLKYTHASIQTCILDALKDANIDYEIFMHTYKFNSPYQNPRAGEINIALDFDDYKLLNPDHIIIDDQDQIKMKLNMYKYRTKPDPYNSNYICIDNIVCALYSKMKLGTMVEDSGKTFDYVVFLRPDVLYLDKFDVRYLSWATNHAVCIPNFALFPKFNDRFCIANNATYKIVANLFKQLLPYSQENMIHSEPFQYHILTSLHQFDIKYIPIHFNRVRANGKEEADYGEVKNGRKSANLLVTMSGRTEISQAKPPAAIPQGKLGGRAGAKLMPRRTMVGQMGRLSLNTTGAKPQPTPNKTIL